jgi:hypothetical protein
MEGKTFGHDIIKAYTGKEAKPYVPMPRARPVFLGFEPSHLHYARYEETAFFDEKGVMVRPHFYWWHTAAEGSTKFPPRFLLRDTKINAHLVCRILNSKHIPATSLLHLRDGAFFEGYRSGLSRILR